MLQATARVGVSTLTNLVCKLLTDRLKLTVSTDHQRCPGLSRLGFINKCVHDEEGAGVPQKVAPAKSFT